MKGVRVDKEEVVEAIAEAAIVLLHREIRLHGEVRLTQADFDEAEFAREARQAIQLEVGPDESVIFTHVKAEAGKAVS